MRQNQTAVTADDSGDCSEYWLVDKVVGDVKFGKCCTTKYNGKSDFVYEVRLQGRDMFWDVFVVSHGGLYSFKLHG